MGITQDWFIIDSKNWFLAIFKTFEQKCDELALPIYTIEKQEPAKISKELQQRIDNWLLDSFDEIMSGDKDNYFNEETRERNCYKTAVWNFINDFDKIDEDFEFIEYNKEDELEAWQEQRLLILNYLKTL